MRAGQLRQRVTLLARTVVSDGMGSQTESWSAVATLPAMVTASTARYAEGAGQDTPVVTHTVKVRARPDLTAENRFAWDGSLLEIVDVSPNAKGSELTAVCRKRVGEAYP